MNQLFSVTESDVDLWSLELDLPRADEQRLDRFLSDVERARADRFVFAVDRVRYAVAHGLLRLVLSGYLGVEPGGIVIETQAHGKPRLAGSPQLRFSLAHSGSRALLAVSLGREVGVDLEERRELEDLEGLVRTCFSPAERAALAALPAPRRQAAFLAGWTCKEAFLKALGAGFSRPLDSFDVALVPGQPAALLRVAGDPEAPSRYALLQIDAGPRFVAALAVEGREVALHARPSEAVTALLAGSCAIGTDGEPRARAVA